MAKDSSITGLALISCDIGWLRIGLCSLVVLASACSEMSEPPVQPSYQCGHWVTLRALQLAGHRGSLTEITSYMPFREKGHSLYEIRQTLKRYGMDSEGRRLSYEQLMQMTDPVIAHLSDPGHFVVVLSASDSEVALFDGEGARTLWPMSEFYRRWSGTVLISHDHEDAENQSLTTARADGPRLTIEQYMTDIGGTPSMGGPVKVKIAVVNEGSDDLVIDDMQVGCTCLEARWPTDPLPAGAKGYVELTYDPRDKTGGFIETAVVYSNDAETPRMVIEVSGTVDAGVTAYPKRLELERMHDGEIQRRWLVVNGAHNPERLVNRVSSTVEGLRVTAEILDEDQKRQRLPAEHGSLRVVGAEADVIELTFVAESMAAGHHRGILSLGSVVEGHEHIQIPLVVEGAGIVRARPSLLFVTDREIDGGRVVVDITVDDPGGTGVQIQGMRPEEYVQYRQMAPHPATGDQRYRLDVDAAGMVKAGIDAIKIQYIDQASEAAGDVKVPVHIWRSRADSGNPSLSSTRE